MSTSKAVMRPWETNQRQKRKKEGKGGWVGGWVGGWITYEDKQGGHAAMGDQPPPKEEEGRAVVRSFGDETPTREITGGVFDDTTKIRRHTVESGLEEVGGWVGGLDRGERGGWNELL